MEQYSASKDDDLVAPLPPQADRDRWMEERLGEKKEINYDYGVAFLLRVKRVLDDERKFYELLCLFQDYARKRVDIKDFVPLVKRKLSGHKELVSAFNTFLPDQEINKSSINKQAYGNPKDLNKPISELNFSKWENITPSYWKFPERYLQPNVSGRTKADASVLNDHWVLIAPKDNRNFRIRDKDEDEEAALECEDKRYEMDRVIERFKTTATRVGSLLGRLQLDAPPSCEFDHGHLDIEKFFTASSLKCITELYDYRGLEVVDNMRRDARKVLPIILARLKMMRDRWIAEKSNFEEKKRKYCTMTIAEIRHSKSQRLPVI